MIGLDSSAIIDMLRGDKLAENAITSINEEVAITHISYLELMFGIDFSNPKHKFEENLYDKLLKDFVNLDLDISAIKKSSEIAKSLKKRGESIDPIDCFIAGILLQNGITKIITRKAKEFSKIKELEVISY